MKPVLARSFVALISVAALILWAPNAVMARSAANYGYDWRGSPYNFPANSTINLFDGAERAAYYQGLSSYSTMTRDVGTGANLEAKLHDDDPSGIHYEILNVLSHTDTPHHILTRPYNVDGQMSCLYDSGVSLGEHSHQVNGTTRPAVLRGRIQSATIPSVDWTVFHGCSTAYEGDGSSLVKAAYLKGSATSFGFLGPVKAMSIGENGQTFQYNFQAKYWQSLWMGNTCVFAADEAQEQVHYYMWDDYGGYNQHAMYGGGRTIN